MAWVTFVISNHCYKSCSTSTKRKNQLLKTSPFHTSWWNSLAFLLLAYVCISWFSSAEKMLACIKIEKKDAQRCFETVVTSASDKTLLPHLPHSICAQECNLGKGLHMTFCWGASTVADIQPCPPHHCWACSIVPKWRLKQKLPLFQKKSCFGIPYLKGNNIKVPSTSTY